MRLRRTPHRRRTALALTAAALAFAVYLAKRRRKHGIQFFRSFTVSAPPPAVYDYCAQMENFPACFSHVKNIRRTGNDNEWRWALSSPLGDIEWTTWMTESIPDKAIAWESAPGEEMRCAGVIQFTESGQSSTRVDVRVAYHPRSRHAALALAAGLGRHPKQHVDECVARVQARFDEDVPSPAVE